jgi:hypothetical protein
VNLRAQEEEVVGHPDLIIPEELGAEASKAQGSADFEEQS